MDFKEKTLGGVDAAERCFQRAERDIMKDEGWRVQRPRHRWARMPVRAAAATQLRPARTRSSRSSGRALMRSSLYCYFEERG